MEPVRGYQLPSGTAQCSQHHSKNNVHHPASPTSSIPHPDLIHAVPINNYSPIAVPSFSLLNSSVSSFHDASGSHNISDGYFPTKASSWDGSMAPMSPFSQGVTDCTFPLPADINQAARQHNIFASTCHISESPSSPPRTQLSFECKWEGCHSTTCFRREGDLIRHLRTIHISPAAYRCPENNCPKAFGRKDHLKEHIRGYHRRTGAYGS